MRNALLTSGTSNLVTSGFTVGQHFVSKALEERVAAQAQMPGAEVKKPDGTTGTVDPAATDEQKIQARLTGAEINTESLTNSILFINEGPDAKAVVASPDAPTDTQGRLANLEKRMDAIESQMPELAKRYGLIYTPYAALESSEPPTDKSRMENVEKRYASMNKMIKTLVTLKQSETEAD
ncbi:type III secretion effector protein [Pseudomonas sp. L13]|nr:type III secretion effector protein [Pseudomonas sp. L13]